MKRLLMASVCTSTLFFSTVVRADESSNRWLAGQVDMDLEVAGGAGRVIQAGQSVRLSVRVDADAWVAVYAIDAQGAVRWLFPRFWEDDGWMEAGRRVRLEDRGLAYELDRRSGEGMVFVQAVASPVPFDWRLLGVRAAHGECEWLRDGAPLRVQGDPLEGFNEINRLLFRCWDEAVFVTDTVAYHLGRRFDHPTYLCGVCSGRHRGYHDAWVQVRMDFASECEGGRNFSRRIHRPLYVYCAERRSLGHGLSREGDRRVRHEVADEMKRRAVHARVERAPTAVRVEVPRRGATPPGPDSDARSGGRRFRQAEPAVSGGAKPIGRTAKLALASRVEHKRERAR